ncbi:DUF4955 domain-containing protein [Pelagicoccus sp. NFK12]|uniref:DUF4955 domain-containing protein n=1 Tax=Pelagicoccus enzymogenes TaxID=2773457 RepID=A0A927FAW1_9BACT|nr:DUF4955 domain-containing protein [Pelagicoccus enzymogenes]MBD5780078.1 DUF4955 domain-containing protein [Pelagicoccus enzymogenes]
MNILRAILALTVTASFAQLSNSQNIAPSWIDFVDGRAEGRETIFPDYSFAGYHFSERPIPDTSSWTQLQVTDFGAIPDDNLIDIEGIQAALDAAHAIETPVVVNFPAGRFILGAGELKDHVLEINRSHIVLKGAGDAPGGTELYFHEYRDKELPEKPRLLVRPKDYNRIEKDKTVLAQCNELIPLGAFSITVNDPSKLSVGQDITLFHQSLEAVHKVAEGLTFNPLWNMGKGGIRIYEEHTITAIDGNRVTFKNPVQLHIPAGAGTTQLWPYEPIEEVGIEGIRFSSGWAHYPQEFKHHLNWEVDYAYKGLHLMAVKNSWIRNCTIADWNVGLNIDDALAVTVEDVTFSGKAGHTSGYPRDSYGVLFNRIVNETDNWHGIGFRWTTTACVFLDSVMTEDQSVDCHGYHPYSNLIDSVKGGRFSHNGGNQGSYPNGGPHITFWNFEHNASAPSTTYDFWSPEVRKIHNYVKPNFVGLRSPGEAIIFEDVNKGEVGIDELREQVAYPPSLFRAQLQLRLHGSFITANNAAPGHPAELANDGDPTTKWISDGELIGSELILDLGTRQTVSGAKIQEDTGNVDGYQLHAWQDGGWVKIHDGKKIGSDHSVTFDPVETRRVKLVLNRAARATLAAIAEFNLISQ